MEETEPRSSSSSIPILAQTPGSGRLVPPPRARRSTFSHSNGRLATMANPYGEDASPGNGIPEQEASLLAPDFEDGNASTSSLPSPLTVFPESVKLAQSLESLKEPEPVPFKYPVFVPARPRFPLIDSPEPDSPTAGHAPSENGLSMEDDGSSLYSTESETEIAETSSVKSVAVAGEVVQGAPQVMQAPKQPEAQAAEVVEMTDNLLPQAATKKIPQMKTREGYVKYLIDEFRKIEKNSGCEHAEWMEKYPSVKGAANAVADKIYGPQKKEETKKTKETMEIKEIIKIKADRENREGCRAQGHQPRPPTLSPPHSSFNGGAHQQGKSRRLVARFFQKIKNLFKKGEPASQVYEMEDLARVPTNRKGKERVNLTTPPEPRAAMEKPRKSEVVEVENGYFVKITHTAATRCQVGYGEEVGETSAEGAKLNDNATCEDSGPKSTFTSEQTTPESSQPL
ncbi:hypothetical protein F4781DRAFT_433626 [Annulohypoxylon bovei var. microspora]|nr:hypothetical protein F4781DRAFT_433626 [Annulohypoxylon bovei var. microspora]